MLNIVAKIRSMSTYNKFIYGIVIAYLFVTSIIMVWHQAWFSPDQFFAMALVGSILLGRFKLFIWDWVPVLLFFFGYEYLRGLIPFLSLHVHITPMIKIDTFIFGYVPTIKLQSTLFQQNVLHWYDYAAVIFYISHFIMPMIIGFYLWLGNRKLFKEYTVALLALSYAAFATYIIFPAMPPWMASSQGYLPPLQKIMDPVMTNFAQPIHLPTIYQFFKANDVAAIPSLHAAFPVLITLFMFRRFKLYGALFLPYVAGVWFSVIYLGEHYFTDVAIGCLYAVVAFGIVTYRKAIINKVKLAISYVTVHPRLATEEEVASEV